MSDPENPFFSIVLPTKNRAAFLELAIESILAQTINDYELLVIDNGSIDNHEECAKKVYESYGSENIKYFRTGGRSMPDNWNYGIERTKGRYITILEDKQVLKPHALETIQRLLKKKALDALVWMYDVFDDSGENTIVYQANGTGENIILKSDDVMQAVLSDSRKEFDRIFPRGLNSCFSQHLKQKMLDGQMKAVCAQPASDYAIGFQCLAYSEFIGFIDEALCVVGGMIKSNGRLLKQKGGALEKYVRELNMDLNDFCNRLPLKSPYIISNIFYNNYEEVRRKIGSPYFKYDIDLINYLCGYLSDVIDYQKSGADVNDEIIEWRKIVNTLELKQYKYLFLSLLTQFVKNKDKFYFCIKELQKKESRLLVEVVQESLIAADNIATKKSIIFLIIGIEDELKAEIGDKVVSLLEKKCSIFIENIVNTDLNYHGFLAVFASNRWLQWEKVGPLLTKKFKNLSPKGRLQLIVVLFLNIDNEDSFEKNHKLFLFEKLFVRLPIKEKANMLLSIFEQSSQISYNENMISRLKKVINLIDPIEIKTIVSFSFKKSLKKYKLGPFRLFVKFVFRIVDIEKTEKDQYMANIRRQKLIFRLNKWFKKSLKDNTKLMKTSYLVGASRRQILKNQKFSSISEYVSWDSNA